jgi:hypothetical protein
MDDTHGGSLAIDGDRVGVEDAQPSGHITALVGVSIE